MPPVGFEPTSQQAKGRRPKYPSKGVTLMKTNYLQNRTLSILNERIQSKGLGTSVVKRRDQKKIFRQLNNA
jgi:hypothetical protein